MEKIKYLIIFTLLLALGLLYPQITDYKNITNQLINMNDTIEKEKNNLTKILNIYKLENSDQKNIIHNKDIQIKQLNQIIITLEENLSTQKLKFQKNIYTLPVIAPIYNKIPNIESNSTTLNNDDININPTILFNEEQNIDGFHIELKQKF